MQTILNNLQTAVSGGGDPSLTRLTKGSGFNREEDEDHDDDADEDQFEFADDTEMGSKKEAFPLDAGAQSR